MVCSHWIDSFYPAHRLYIFTFVDDIQRPAKWITNNNINCEWNFVLNQKQLSTSRQNPNVTPKQWNIVFNNIWIVSHFKKSNLFLSGRFSVGAEDKQWRNISGHTRATSSEGITSL